MGLVEDSSSLAPASASEEGKIAEAGTVGWGA